MYQQSKEIENRLHEILRLIKKGGQSTPKLAAALHVSRPTVSRSLSALRERGFSIRSVRTESGWAYEVAGEPSPTFANGKKVSA